MTRHKLVVAVGAAILLFGLLLVAGRNLTLPQLVAKEVQIRHWIDAYPRSSLAIGLTLYYATSLIPGMAGKSIVFGWLFGFLPALIIALAALTAAATTTFCLSRYLFQDAVQSRFAYYLARHDQLLKAEGAFFMLALRLMPTPYTAVNYLAGASHVGGWTFFWTTAVGMSPKTAIYVYLGTQLPTLQLLQEQGVRGVFRPSLLAAIVAIAAFPWLARWLASRLGMRSPDPPPQPTPPPAASSKDP